MGDYFSLTCTDSPCECRISFGSHKGNKFTDLADDYLPLARSYTLSREMNMYPKLRDCIVSHLDRETTRRAAVAEAARLEERARELDKVYADALDMPIDDLLNFLDMRGCQNLRTQDRNVAWNWRAESDEQPRLRAIIDARVREIFDTITDREIDAEIEADRIRFYREQGVVGFYEDLGKLPCWVWTGPRTSQNIPKGNAGRTIFEKHRPSADWLASSRVCGRTGCINPWHRLTRDETVQVITLGLVKFYEEAAP